MSFPEDRWERLHPWVEVPEEVAAALLAPLGRLRRLTLLTGGKANTNVRAELDGHPPVVLRVYERDPDALPREAALTERVRRVVPVPDLLLRGALPDGTPVGIFRFLPGVSLTDLLRDPARAAPAGHALGRALARLHTAFPVTEVGLYAPDLSLARRFDSVTDSFADLLTWSLTRGRARKRLPPALRARLRDAVPELTARIAPLDAHPGLAHGDVKSPNLLFRADPDGTVTLTGLLDWEFACPFTPMLDLAILLRHRDALPDAFVNTLHDTYGHHAWLPADHAVTEILDLMNLVGFLNAGGERPTLFADGVRRIARTLDRRG